MFPGATQDHPLSLGDGFGRFLGSGDFAASTIESYELTLEGVLDDLAADIALDRVSRTRLEAHLRARYSATAPAPYNRNLATIGSLFAWAVARPAPPPPERPSAARAGTGPRGSARRATPRRGGHKAPEIGG